ncbi:hypothetical protein HK105_209407, partial [Polyrhizophydium stewartii]
MRLGGIGVSRGYINLPDLTAQRFVPDPFSPEPGARMFRTGDLGRLLPDGNFEILGRMDDQVKLKGYRIELDEVAAAMMRHPRVSAAAAVVKDKTHLVGFVVPADVDHDELRDVVAAALPAYMVPAVFVGLAVMPTNTNGKTDKKALAAMHVEIAVDALQTDTERALAAVWSQVLGVQVADIGRATSFFALGGDSISAIRLVAKAKQQGLTLSSALIFKAPTLAKMALAATVSETRAAVSSAPVTGSVALTPIQHMFFAHDWINISHFNQSFVVTPRDTLDIAALTAAIARLAEHHDMLRARFAQGDDGAWSQTLLPPSPQTDAANVLAVVVESDDDALACIREAQESLSITHGPLLAVRLLHMHDGSQRLFFGIHHLVVDLVSWRVLLDDLETLLRGRPLAPKTLSFQAWAARMAAHAATLDAAPWRDLIGDHTTLLATQPPAASVPVRAFHARAVLDDATTAQLDAANAPFNTNIQELVLAALVLSLADVAGCASSPAQLCIELEGHGREPFAADLDVSSTVGWFTSVFPASTASDIGAVVRQVKHKIRSVPLKGLSHGMIKHLAPPTADNAFVKAHGGHAVAFNYLGRFQSLEAEDAFFVADSSASGYWSVRHDDRMFHAIELNCAHDGPRLVLSATVEDWIVSEPTMQAWLDRWQVWMQRVVAHCVDPATHGGRTVSDVPLMASQAAVEQAEAELAAVLSLRARDIVDMYPVTPLQAGFLSAMMRDASEYTVQSAFDVTGNMDVQRLRAAWHAVAMAHPIVRTVFVSTPSGLVQAVAKDDRTEWAELDGVWSADADALQAATDAFMAADRARGFSMASASFHRFTVARVADGRLRVFWALHHSVTDGWSMPLLMADLMRTCAGADISAKRAQFRDHVEWLLAQDQAASHLFWRRSLEHAADAGKITSPKPRASELGGKKYGELHASVELPHLAAVCKAHGVTTSTVLRLAWALVLRHFTRNEHVLFGSVVSGRDGGIQGIDEIVGVLINTIAVPARLSLDASVASVLAAMHAFSADAIAHSHVGLVDAQRVAGGTAGSKLFDTLMVFENYPSSDAGVPLDFALESFEFREFVDQPLSVTFLQKHKKIQIDMTFEASAVPMWFAQNTVDKLVDILSRVCSPSRSLNDLSIDQFDVLSNTQQAQIAQFSRGPAVPVEFSCIHHAFEAQAAATPDVTALDDGFATLTYAALDARANQLAHTLQRLGAATEVSVAVIATRSIEFVVGILGVLKAGAAFVPIEASTPQERIRFMLESCGVPIVATTADASHAKPSSFVGKIVHIDNLPADTPTHKPADIATARSLAYTIFTSGTTGTPKGVLIEHGSIHTRVKHHPIVAHLGPDVRMSQTFTVGFDACLQEVFSALTTGATLVLRSKDEILDMIAQVDVLSISPSGLQHIQPEDYPRLKCILLGAEACPQSLVDRWADRVAFYSDYGPTEVTIMATCTARLAPGDRITLGRPLANTAIHIFDDAGRRVPPGVKGHVFIGGVGIARGYLGQPDLTTEKFVADIDDTSKTMYDTGDIGRWTHDGQIEYLGRSDDQVKIKGYRIELEEVAKVLGECAGVESAVAMARDGKLVAFVAPAGVDVDAVLAQAGERLPGYMKALAAMHVEIAVDALQTDTERALAAVWSQVLGVQVADIGRATSFFALGGDSISAIRLVAKAKQQGLTLSSALIFKAPTLAKMALRATVTETRAAVSSAPVTGSVALTPIQHMFFAHDWINISHFNQSFVVTPRDTLDIAALTAAIAQLAEHHDMLRARFAQGDDGVWSQTLLPPSPQTDAANESLSITHGPLLAVRLLHMHDGSQRLFFGIHHLVVDLVSWRVLLDDLETLLRGRPLAPKTLSFQAWAAGMAAHAETLDAAPWRDLIGDHTTLLVTQPPAASVPVRAFHARAVLDGATTAQLDAANAPFNTNIQELVLAALVLSLADVAGCASSPAQLCIELEGHGREPFAADLDVSSTVGWFTSVFPVAFSASTASDIGAVVRQVKHKIRSVPLKGLSHGMIKHLAPPTADNAFVKAHDGHAVAFNYLGRFQSLEAEDAFFVADSSASGYWSVRHDDRMFHAIELNCAHDGPRLVLSATVEDWIVSEPTMQAWLDRWQVWMQRVVAHCVDPATHGGRTVADVPLMASQAAVGRAEAELAAVLSLRARDGVDMYPVTPLQAERLSAMRDGNTVQSAFDVTGNMDVQRLRAAWHAVAMAHPIVRTVFVSTPSGLVQAVAKDDHTEWTELDGVWGADDDALQAATDAFMAADRAHGFSMASASFHRFTVARVADGRLRVFWALHHSVTDGWSMPLLMADLMRTCAGADISAKRAQFRDHVEWLLAQDQAASHLFWRRSLEHAADAGKITSPKPRASELGGKKYGELHAGVELPHLAAVCKAHGVTTSTVLRLAWALVLRHFTRNEHVLFGSVVSGRDGGIQGIDEIVGVLINTIAVPARLPLDASIASVLADVHAFSADAIAHSHVGLVDVQRVAGVTSDSRLFDTIMPIKSKEFVDQPVSVVFVQQNTTMQVAMTFETLTIQDWFAQSMADKLVDVLSRLCAAGGDLGAVTIADVDALTAAQQAMIARFSHGERVPLPFSLVHHGFEARAKQHPDWRAVEHGDAHLSYGDLDACGCALAAALASHGVQRGSRVAVVMQRSIEFVVALVGVLKAGATIVPVDSSFPADRIQFMLDDASVCAIVTTASEAGRIAQLSVGDRAVVVADARALLASGVSFTPAAQHTATGDDDAFIVYTSGSTGKPKGVPIRHQGVINVAMHCSPLSGFVEGARVPQFMAIGFDVCEWEVWGSLSNGATLVMRTESVFDSLRTVDALVMTPTGLRQLGSPSDWPRLKAVTVTGEVCPKELKDLWSPHVRFVNGGCPSEATIVAVLVGVVGEMCLGGIGVSRGYINLPDLTAQRFVPDPFSPEPGARMFRTGDLGRLLPDGNFEILGRMDDQVKLKGYRIELDEVAAAMMRHPRVSAAAAVVKDKTHLVGFVVPADVDHDELRDVVAAALPAYMVPAVFVGLAVMPTNTNGKTDKKALAAMHVEIAVDALQTDTERALAAVWSQVLGVHVADIGRATSFFALGGDSISAIKAAAAMQRAGISITVPQLFKAQTVARVAALADAADAHDGARLRQSGRLHDETLAELAAVGSFVDAYPATPLQAGMVAATMQDARAYVNQVPLRATRTVSLESLRGALRAVVQHHAILRTSFVSTVAGGIVQVVRASADAAECVAVAAPLAQHLAADKARGFSLADASWIRAALVCDPAGSAQHVVVTIHHALYDGWSLPMIMRDLAAALDGHALEPRPAFRTVVDFIAAQDAAATEAFWTQQLVGLEPAQPLSLGHSARTDDEDAPLAQACSTPMAELQRAAQRAGVTVAVVLKAAWAATLRKFTRSHDVVFGEVLANRDIAVAGADRIVGPLLNTVPCRVVLDDTARAADLVATMQAQHGAVLSHSHAALVDVQRWAGVQGDGKLFNTLFVYENMDTSVKQSSFEIVSGNSSGNHRSTDFDLLLFPDDLSLHTHAEYGPHLSQSQAASILAEFDFGVQQLVSALSDKATIESLWTLSPAQQAMIARFSHGERVPLPFALVHHGFEARAKQHPDWRAVEHGDAHLSYGDLDACGCALAATLASHGVQHGSRVAVVMQRSIEFVVALVGVPKAGATIVPVDSSFPADRIQFMLDDASVCAIVTTASEAGCVAQLSVGDRAVVVADARALLASGESFTPAAQHIATGDDDAFIVYTSGSTGKPKGVPVPHGGVINVVNHTAQLIGCSDKSRMAQFMAIGFDACQWETWSALLSGSTLVLRQSDKLELFAQVDAIIMTPTGLSKLGHPSQYSKLKTVTVTGENCPSELKDLWSSHVRFVNGGGPSEVSILGHIGTLVSSDKVVLGKVLPNYASYVLDEKYHAVPVGVVGQVHTGGQWIARGYINLPDLTAQRFVPDPFSPEPGARMFRTGDLGRLLPDGNFEILGRMDDQVKLKGYRIELDEVAAAMMRHPRVSAAAAVVKDKTHLVGFVVPADVDHDELRDVVAAALPAYMVPAVFVGLAVMPTNTNGKTDKKALAAMHVEIAVDALQTDTERALAAVWSQVLGVHVADIGRATSFFALGGDSISAIRLVAKAKQQGLTLSSALIFKAPTLAKMALAATVSETRAAVSSAPVTGSVALTPIQHMFFAHDWINISHFNQSFVVTPRDTLDIAALTAAIARLAEHHDMLRARFAQGDDGVWSQTLLPPSPQTDAANVLAVVVESDDDALACIREAQESLSITHGPLLAVRLLHMHDGSQRLFFGIHHLVVDLVSWRVILDDLETLLRGRPLAPKTLSFQAWAARMAEHAATLDAAPWRDLIGDHTTLLATQPPAASVPVHAFHARAVLDDATTAQLDAANAPFNTNIQELVLAALVLSLADVAGCASSPAQLCIELEGHGREPFAADLDVSSTVGWFTSVFPVAFSASTASDIGAVVRQVKHKIRSVPLKGLSHGMIKHLAPPTADNAFVKAHGGHAVAFNYLGRFQSLEAEDAFFVADSSASGYWSVRHDDRMFHAIELNCAHDGPRLVLSATVEDWIVSEPTMQAWLDCWQVWMQRVVAHCVDPATHGGRTVSDVPLMASQAAVEQAEAELAAVLSLRARDIVDMYPVTPLQAGFLSAMMRDASEYTVQSAFDVTGNMDVQRLRAAWHAVAMAHPIVRTVFVSTPSGLVQAVAKDDRTEWAELDGVWSADADALQAATDAFMAADRARGFSMASASFHRFTVARVADGRLRVFWALHHSVTDGWSMPLLMADLMRTCAGADISAKRAQFRDHVEWLLAQDQAASHLFWRRSLEHAADAGKITSPKPRASELGGKKYGELHAGVELPHLAAVCKAHGVTTSTVLRLAWALVLRHFTRNEHVLFGSVVSGRDGGIQGIDEIVGVLINTIAVPARLPLDASIASVLADVHAFSADAIAHSHVGLVDVQRVAGVTSDSRLFDTIMVFENYPSSDADVPLDFALEPIKSKEFVDQPVSVVFVQQNTTMQVAMTFETLTIQDWFAQSMADKLVDVLSRLCAAGGDLGAVTIADVDALTAAQQAMIARFSHGERVPLPFSLVHHGFEARAKQHPDWRAVEHGDAHLSYGDLDACGCALAAALASHGVQRGSRVAVVMQRSIEFVVALVGVLKAGATIVPVDSSFPADRIQFMLDDASVCAIVTTASEAGRIAQLSVGDRAVVVADARALLASGVSFTPAAQHMATSDDDAFIVYTSGSTGKPKGVPVPHIGAANIIALQSEKIGCVERARFGQFMAIGFDACQWETWSALNNGSVLVLREQDAFKALTELDALMITPTGLAQFGRPSDLTRLRVVTVAGEAVPNELKDLWASHVRFNNAYGPTEISIISHMPQLVCGDLVHLGGPIANSSCYILDRSGRQVPIGVVGEMYIGGIGVSRGYINLPDLTAQRFVPDPFSPEPGARMFRTGDLGRLLPDGNFEILGRMDDQVKLKGYRIELDEVAAAMMRHPRVSAAAAVVKDKTHLVGFVVPADVDHDELRDVVAAALPAYMVPAVFVGLAVMPTNTNGKTDKKALAAMHVEIAVDALQTDTERALAAVWSQVLGVQVADIGRATSFFALGGDSISAIRLVAKAKQQGLTLSSALIFKAPTLAKMALAATVSETRAAVSSAPVTGSVALTPIQHMFFAHDWINISHFNQSFVVTPRDTLDIGTLTAAIARLAEHHDMLRARFAQGDDGAWSQTLLPPSPQTDADNVLAVVVESDDDALACIREAQESLSITHGPLLAVRLLHMHDGSQRLFFGIHHLVVDLVSWRVLLDDLETLLRGRPLAPKTLSFQAWAARMAAHAATLDAAPWRDLIGDHTTLLATQPPAAGVPVRAFHAHAVLDDATTAQLDAANAPFNTNIQELVLAALVLSLADVAGCASSPAQLCIELEGHGREPFAADLDVSSTVGWFTSVFPVAFSASTASDIGAVVRQVKHKIRSVPLKGLSYGMIKHLAPPTADNAFVKAHGGHAVAFNYLGRFQSLEAADAYFVADNRMSGYWSVRSDDRMFHAIELNCAHDGPRLVLSATVEDWIVSEPTMQAWLDRWQVWMQRVVAHCVDPATHGGRTVSDVPLMASQAAVEQAEAELAAVLSLRARDIVDMYPVTPLQAGFLSAMMRDASEYTVQSTFDVTGNMDVQRLRAAWHAVAMAHPIVRTVFVSTPSGLVQAVTKDDRTEWTELDGVWSADADELQAATDAFLAADRARGFSMASASFHRFTVAHIAGADINAKRAQFRDHVEWLQAQDQAASQQFWRKSLEHAADAGKITPPKPRASELTGAKYGELHTSVELPHLEAVCKAHGVTTSTVLRLAWALVLRHFTRNEHVLFGIVGVLINTIAVPARLPLDASIASVLADVHAFSADAIAHSHVGLVDVQRVAGVTSDSRLFDTIMVFENYPSGDADVPLDFALEPIKSKEFVDQPVSVVFVQQNTTMQVAMTFETLTIQDWFAQSMADKLVDVLSRLCAAGGDLGAVTIADVDALTAAQQAMIARFSHGERVPLPFSLVHHGFEARAKQHPDWRAVEHGDAHLSYGDLDACGCALAAALASHGVQRGSRVAVVMQRSIEFVVALVGVLKAGATIVPVDSSFPADRIQFMLDDASVCAIVTTASEAGRIAQLSVGDRAVVVADARALLASGVSFTPAAQHTATGDDDAFIVYTSGSTGKPKGVP